MAGEELMPTSHLILRVLAIVWIDLSLAGDNALVIAMAVRSLPTRQRRIGSALGAAAAVALRVGLTFVAAQILNVQDLKLSGGLMNRYPILIYAGAGILGQVAGEMILTDRFTVGLLHPSDMTRHIVEGVLVVAVMAAGKLLSRKRPA